MRRIRANRWDTARQIASKCRAGITPYLVTHIAAKRGYHRRAARRKFVLSHEHKRARLHWAQTHQDEGFADFAHYIFTNECTISSEECFS